MLLLNNRDPHFAVSFGMKLRATSKRDRDCKVSITRVVGGDEFGLERSRSGC